MLVWKIENKIKVLDEAITDYKVGIIISSIIAMLTIAIACEASSIPFVFFGIGLFGMVGFFSISIRSYRKEIARLNNNIYLIENGMDHRLLQ